MKVPMRSLALAGILGVAFATVCEAADPTGTWLVEHRDGIVRIDDCGLIHNHGGGGAASAAQGTLCGVVVWLKDPVDPATGQPPVDQHNADPAKRGQPLMGLQVIFDMRPSWIPGRWDGRVYNMDDGRIYDGNLILTGESDLRVQGCELLICRGEAWTRQPLPDPPAPSRAQRAR